MARVHCFQSTYRGYDIMLSSGEGLVSGTYYATPTEEDSDVPDVKGGHDSAAEVRWAIDEVLDADRRAR